MRRGGRCRLGGSELVLQRSVLDLEQLLSHRRVVEAVRKGVDHGGLLAGTTWCVRKLNLADVLVRYYVDTLLERFRSKL